jgi:hypothetical protein
MHVRICGDYLSKFAFSLTFIRLGNKTGVLAHLSMEKMLGPQGRLYQILTQCHQFKENDVLQYNTASNISRYDTAYRCQ